MPRKARVAVAAAVAAGAAALGPVGAVSASQGSVPLPERAVTADAGASVRLGGATGHLRVPRAEPHADALSCRAATSGCPRSGGNQSGGATEAFGMDAATLLLVPSAVIGLAATSLVAHRTRGFAKAR